MNSFKTRLCKNFEEGFCQFGNKCTFAHGERQLKKFDTPQICWFYNTSVCTNKNCPYLHIVSDNIRKPLKLQKPCFNYHVQKKCYDYCKLDHFELTKDKFEHHFPKIDKTWSLDDIFYKYPIDSSTSCISDSESEKIVVEIIVDEIKTLADKLKKYTVSNPNLYSYAISKLF